MIKYINLISDKYKCRNCGEYIEDYGSHVICNINYVKLFPSIKHNCFSDIVGIADIASFKIEEVK